MSLLGGSMIETVAQRDATPSERRLAFTVWSLALLLAVGMHAFRNVDVGPVPSFLPGVFSASFVTMLSIAAILRFRYRASGDVALAYLGVAFTFAACATVPYVLAFLRGSADASGVGEDARLSAWYAIVWHAGFLLLLAGYGATERRGARQPPTLRAARSLVRRYAAAVATLAIATDGVLWLARGALPALIANDGHTPLFSAIVRALLLVPPIVLSIELVRRTRLRRSPDLWLAIVISLAFVENYVGSELAGRRFTLAWYVGNSVGLAAGAIFLAVQMRLVFELLRAFASHNRALAEIAQHDSLTGLLNRAAFDVRFEALWNQCRRVREPISLLVLDLDFFKSYNDAFGHVAGDEALRRIGRELAAATIRPTDLTCRIGGEEFAIVLPFTDERGAAVVAERIVVRVRDLGIAHAPGLPLDVLTISVGAATSHGGAVPHPVLFERADAALYHAKRSGRDRVGSVRAARPSVRAV